MLKSPRLFHLFARTALPHETILQQSLRRNVPGRIANTTSRCTPLRRNFATSFQQTRPSSQTQILRSWRTSGFCFGRQARHNGTKATTEKTEEETSKSLTQLTMGERMKAMSKKYGWVVVGIYLGLSALDFPFCFLAVRLFGTERIAAIEHAIMDKFWELTETVVPQWKEQREQRKALENAANEATREGDGPGVMDAGKGGHEDASIWTQLLLAYGVHKSLIFFRIPLTLAITPKVVKTLRKWGWSIGKAK